MNPGPAETEPPAGGVVGNIAEFGNDIATLVELQAKLAAYDAKECVGRATLPLVLLAAGGAVALASLPILLLGVADLVARLSGLPDWGSRLIVAAVSLAAAAVVAFISYKEAIGSITSFRRSTEEFTRNLSWVRTVLVHSGRAAGRPKR